MSKYNLNFNIDKSGVAKISVSSAGIAFSKESIELLGSPQRVNIGIDKSAGVLGVRVAVDDNSIKSYPFVTKEKKKQWLRINSKALLEQIKKTARINELTTSSIPFVATFDEEEQMLIVNLKNKQF